MYAPASLSPTGTVGAQAFRSRPRRVLIVEDDSRVARLLEKFLQFQGFETQVLMNGLQVEPEVRRLEPSLILLDLMLPGRDGLSVCQDLRRFSAVPIIMLTARTDEVDRLAGLGGGADDYVCKPFSPHELVARIHALLRRAEGIVASGVQLHGFRIDDEAQRIAWEEQWLPLTPLEFRLLRKLLSRPGHVFSRKALLEGAGHEYRLANSRVVDSHIKNLRRKIAAARPQGSAIVSVYGMGYRFDPEAADPS
jgi:two-component system response regulator BaeR